MTVTARPRAPRPGRDEADRGAVTLETVILTPALLALIGLLVVGGRVTSAQNVVEQAASEAARTASLARTGPGAAKAARTAATAALQRRGATCEQISISIDTSGFAVPAGQPATVTATVSCTVPLSDLGLPGAPGSHTVSAKAASPLDTYRGRG